MAQHQCTVPELTNYGTTPETAPVHEVPELTTYGTSPDTAPIYENSELELTTNDEVRIEKIDFSIEEQYTNEIPEGSRKTTTWSSRRTGPSHCVCVPTVKWLTAKSCLTRKPAPVTQIVKVGTAKTSMVPDDAPKADTLPEYSTDLHG